MVLWYYDTMVLWYYGTMALWYYGTMVLWYYVLMLPVVTVRPDQPSPTVPLTGIPIAGQSTEVTLPYPDIWLHPVVDTPALPLAQQPARYRQSSCWIFLLTSHPASSVLLPAHGPHP